MTKRKTRSSYGKEQRKKYYSESEEEEEQSSEEEKYNVEKILDRRSVRKGNRRVYQYLVKWEGYPSSQNSWEPTSNLQGCKDLLKDFNNKYNKEKDDKLRRKSLERFAEERKKTSPKSKRKYEEDEESPRYKKRKVLSEEESNDSEFEVKKSKKGKGGRKSPRRTPAIRTLQSPRSPRSPRTPKNTPQPTRTLRSATATKVFSSDNDSIVIEDVHFSVHQSSEEKKQIQRYLERLKDLVNNPVIKLLDPSQLLQAQTFTSKMYSQIQRQSQLITHNSTVYKGDVEEDDEEGEDDQVDSENEINITEDKIDDSKNENNGNEENDDNNIDTVDDSIPMPLDEEEEKEEIIVSVVEERQIFGEISFD